MSRQIQIPDELYNTNNINVQRVINNNNNNNNNNKRRETSGAEFLQQQILPKVTQLVMPQYLQHLIKQSDKRIYSPSMLPRDFYDDNEEYIQTINNIKKLYVLQANDMKHIQNQLLDEINKKENFHFKEHLMKALNNIIQKIAENKKYIDDLQNKIDELQPPQPSTLNMDNINEEKPLWDDEIKPQNEADEVHEPQPIQPQPLPRLQSIYSNFEDPYINQIMDNIAENLQNDHNYYNHYSLHQNFIYDIEGKNVIAYKATPNTNIPINHPDFQGLTVIPNVSNCDAKHENKFIATINFIHYGFPIYPNLRIYYKLYQKTLCLFEFSNNDYYVSSDRINQNIKDGDTAWQKTKAGVNSLVNTAWSGTKQYVPPLINSAWTGTKTGVKKVFGGLYNNLTNWLKGNKNKPQNEEDEALNEETINEETINEETINEETINEETNNEDEEETINE